MWSNRHCTNLIKQTVGANLQFYIKQGIPEDDQVFTTANKQLLYRKTVSGCPK